MLERRLDEKHMWWINAYKGYVILVFQFVCVNVSLFYMLNVFENRVIFSRIYFGQDRHRRKKKKKRSVKRVTSNEGR